MGARERRPEPGDPVVDGVRELSLETQQYVDAVARRLDLHRSDVSALGIIRDVEYDGKTLSPGELAQRSRMSAAAVSALLDRLERAGHVRRRRHERDGRRLVLDRSETSRQTSREMFAPLRAELLGSLSGYSEAELDVAARVIADLTAATRAALAEPLPDPPNLDDNVWD